MCKSGGQQETEASYDTVMSVGDSYSYTFRRRNNDVFDGQRMAEGEFIMREALGKRTPDVNVSNVYILFNTLSSLLVTHYSLPSSECSIVVRACSLCEDDDDKS